MNKSFLAILTAIALPAAFTHAQNLLKNSSFEQAGHFEDHASNWKMGQPDEYGDAWGSAVRVDWRAYDGNFIGAIRGTWAGAGDYGGFWQDAKVEAGSTYRLSAWFWADSAWTANHQQLKIEFWNEDRSMMLAEESVSLYELGEDWRMFSVEATAPEGTGFARAVINVAGAGDSGALQIDSVSLQASW
ncbi:MAG TPA: carbohydrate binding domain-containing protein [Kiritimatiellia bacterium]|nr:carbohydrate binding domain-containing protein [Kiritimatiellia bacterium]